MLFYILSKNLKSALYVNYAPKKRVLIRKDNYYRKTTSKDEKLRFTILPFINALGQSTMKPSIILKGKVYIHKIKTNDIIRLQNDKMDWIKSFKRTTF